MADQINYNFPAIENARGNLQGAAQQLGHLIDDMTNSVQNRLQVAWTGTGGDSYQHIANRWNNAAADMKSALMQLSAATGNAGDGMAQVNRMNAQRFTMG
jgi:WXG100 family type VII secretion target